MQDRPTAVELLEAAAKCVETEIIPAIEGRRQYQARIVASVMRIVAREIEMGEDQLRREVKELCALLGRPEPHLHGRNELFKAALEFNEELSLKIRSGAADTAGDCRDRIFRLVREAVEDKLRITNPRYLARELAVRPGSSKPQ